MRDEETGLEAAGDPVAAAAEAFRAALGEGAQAQEINEIPVQARDDEGEARSETDAPDALTEETEGGEAAAEGPDSGAEAQPDAPLPPSWPADKAGLWESLPPEAQAFIAERDGQMTAAVNAKFREAAELRKAAETRAAAEIGEAQASRQHYADAVDQVMSLVRPQMPPRSMLDRASGDYDPDAYHYRKALCEETIAFLDRHAAQRREIAAQALKDRFEAINGATRDAFVASVPDIADQARAPALFQELIDYAASLGAPADTFDAPTTALEWHVLWKAREYDRLQAAKAKLRSDPKPEPRKAQPAVRPGAATTRGAVEQSRARAAMDRLKQEGSVEAGAAALKHLMKGKEDGKSHQRRGFV